jgi:hypothetical protein
MLLLLSVAFAAPILTILFPVDGENYTAGAVPIQVNFTNESMPVTGVNVSVYIPQMGGFIENLTYSDGSEIYVGSVFIDAEGDYDLIANSTYKGDVYEDDVSFRVNSSITNVLEINSPVEGKNYSAGPIPIQVNFTEESGGSPIEDAEVKVYVPRAGKEETLTYSNGLYVGSISLYSIGDYTLIANTTYEDIVHEKSVSFRVNTSLPHSFEIIHPKGGTKYDAGDIVVQVSFRNATGSPVIDAVVEATLEKHGGFSSEFNLAYDGSTGRYRKTLGVYSKGVYSIKAETAYEGDVYQAEVTFLIETSRLVMKFLKPKANFAYEPGEVEVEIEPWYEGKKANDAEIDVDLYNSRDELLTRHRVNSSNDFKTSFLTLNKDEYGIVARSHYKGENFANETYFRITETGLTVRIMKPVMDGHYGAGRVDVEAKVYKNGEITKNVDQVSAKLFRGTQVVKDDTELGYGWYTYSGHFGIDELGAYRIRATATLGINKEIDSVYFFVYEKVEGGIIGPGYGLPGKRLDMKVLSPDYSYYVQGQEVPITVELKNEEGRIVDDADVTANIYFEGEELDVERLEYDENVEKYTESYILIGLGEYEMVMIAEKPGYSDAEETLEIGTIESFGRGFIPREGLGEEFLTLFIMSPDPNTPYPDDSTVEVRAQVLGVNNTLVTNARVTAEIQGIITEMQYGRNGEYYAMVGPYSRGVYTVKVKAEKAPYTVTKNTTMMIASERANVDIFYPDDDGIVTQEAIQMRVGVTDNRGEVLTDAEVQGILSTPSKVHERISFYRDVSTGEYVTMYTFDERGTHVLKAVGYRPGYLSSEDVIEFDVRMPERGLAFIGINELLLAGIAIGIIIILVTLIKAL